MDGVSLENMDKYLSDILSAKYGEEVRGSIHDAIQACSDYQKDVGYLSDFDYITAIKDKIEVEYRNNDSFTSGYYWNSSLNKAPSSFSEWGAADKVIIPSGHYLFLNVSPALTYIKNRSDDSVTSLKALFAKSVTAFELDDNNASLEIRLDDPCEVYISALVNAGRTIALRSIDDEVTNGILTVMGKSDRILKTGYRTYNFDVKSDGPAIVPNSDVQMTCTHGNMLFVTETFSKNGYIHTDLTVRFGDGCVTGDRVDFYLQLDTGDSGSNKYELIQSVYMSNRDLHVVIDADLSEFESIFAATKVALTAQFVKVDGSQVDSKIRIFSNDYIWWTSYPRPSIGNINEGVGEWISSLDRYITAIKDKIEVEYRNNDSFTSGYYWNSSLNKAPSSSEWGAADKVIIPSGHYLFLNVSPALTYIKNRSDDSVTSLKALFAKSVTAFELDDNNASLEIRLDDPCEVYISALVNAGRTIALRSIPDNPYSSINEIGGITGCRIDGDRILTDSWIGITDNSSKMDVSIAPFKGASSTVVQKGSYWNSFVFMTEKVEAGGYLSTDVSIRFGSGSMSGDRIDVLIADYHDDSVNYKTVTQIKVDDLGIMKERDYKISVDLAHEAVYNNAEQCALVFQHLKSNKSASDDAQVRIVFNDYVWLTNYERYTGSFSNNIAQWISNVSASSNKSGSDSSILVSPNGTKYRLTISDEGVISPKSLIPTKGAFYGNSLLAGFVNMGMCASSIDSDYFSLIESFIKTKYPSYTSERKGGGSFENFTDISAAKDYIDTQIIPYVDDSYDLIVIQLGDNVNTDEKRSIFEDSSRYFMNKLRTKCPTSRIVWMGSWYAQNLMETVKKNASQTGCEFVDIRDLNVSENQGYIGMVYNNDNETEDTYNVTEFSNNGNELTFKVSGASTSSTIDVVSWSKDSDVLTCTTKEHVVTVYGVASHPGDRGFKAIANRFLYSLGLSDSEETYSLS